MRILTPFWPPRPTPTCLSQRVASLLSSQHGCYTGFHFLVHWQNCYLWVASGGKDFYPLNPGILTYDLSRLPPVFIGTELFMFGRICVVPQIRGMPGWILRWLWVVVEKSWCACWPGTSVCGRGRKAGRSIVVSVLFWPEGRKPWKWGVESRRKKCHSNAVSVKGIWD